MGHARQKPPGLPVQRLDQITPENVKQLKVAWTFSLGVEKGQEAAPIVAGNTMFVVAPYPNIVYAIDLTKPGGPSSGSSSPNRPRRRRASRAATWSIAAPPMPTARSSSTPWTTIPWRSTPIPARNCGARSSARSTRGETMTMAPLVVNGKVLVGNSGGELGVRGWLTALDANSGKIAWRAYSTGPDKDVLIGDKFKPFYDQDKGQDLGVNYLAARGLEDRRRHRVGLDHLRPGAEPDLLRHRQSRPLEPRPAPGRQQMDRRDLRPRPGYRRRPLVLPMVAARSARL